MAIPIVPASAAVSTAGLARRGTVLAQLPPLSLYVHLPWCLR